MDQTNRYDWIEFYEKFAKKLVNYKNSRTELINKIKTVYTNINIKLPTLEKDNNIVDVDPFTIFGLFNKHITNSNRIKILTEIKKEFLINANVPTHFDSLPVLNNQNATFYWFIGYRGEHDIDNLWGIFENAVIYAENQSDQILVELKKYFNLAINTKGNGNSKITMGLYWLSHETYINLDDRNELFIYDSGNMPKEFVDRLPKIDNKISADKYFEICRKVKDFLKTPESSYKSLMSLSYAAWSYSEKVNQETKAKKIAEEPTNIDADIDRIHYWIYSAGNNSSYWNEFYDKGIMAIEWGELGDLSQVNSQSEIKQKMIECVDDSVSFNNEAHIIWEFIKVLKPGDIVFVKKGVNKLIAKGTVTSSYFDNKTVI